MAIEIVDFPMKNGDFFHGKMLTFTRPGSHHSILLKRDPAGFSSFTSPFHLLLLRMVTKYMSCLKTYIKVKNMNIISQALGFPWFSQCFPNVLLVFPCFPMFFPMFSQCFVGKSHKLSPSPVNCRHSTLKSSRIRCLRWYPEKTRLLPSGELTTLTLHHGK